MRLGTKIIIGFVCISLLLALIGYFTDQFTSQIRQEQMRYVDEASEIVIQTGEMERSLFQSLIFLNGIREGIASDNGDNIIQELPSAKGLTRQFESELAEFEQSFNRVELYFLQEDKQPEALADLLQSYQVYKAISREWLSLETEDYDRANLMFINSIEPYFRNNIIPEITHMRAYVLSVQEERNLRMEKNLEQAAIANVIATSFSILLAIILAVYIYRSIANPLSRFSGVAQKLGEGDLQARIHFNKKDEIGDLAKAFNAMAEGLQAKTVSKTYVDNIIESIHEALFVTDQHGVLKRVNSATENLTGYAQDEMLGKHVHQFYDLEHHGETYEHYRYCERSFEFALVRKNGETVPVLFSEAKLMDNQGEKVGMVSVASDISERIAREKEIRDSLKEKEVMLAEIHHRVKNNLAVISGLLQLQSFNTDSDEVKKALSDSQMRVQSIALVHEILYKSESLAFIAYDDYITDLLQSVQKMYKHTVHEVEVSARIAPLSLSVNQAIPCSLLITELMVMAHKLASAQERNGRVTLEVKTQDDKIRVLFTEHVFQQEMASLAKAGSLESKLVQTLVKQLKAEWKVLQENENSGTTLYVEFVREM